jgi:PPP family 3-phenylpropionic acid transporter
VYYAFMGTLTTYAPLYFAAHGVSALDVGVLMSLVQVMRIVGPTLWGWVADHSSRRVLVLRMTALGALAAFSGIAFGRAFGHFFIAMACLNLFTSAQGPLTEALMLAEMRGDTSRYGRVRLWGSLGFIAAVMAAGFALDRLGVGALPWLAGGVLLLVLAQSLRIREAPAGAWRACRGGAAVRGAAQTGGDRLLRAGRADGRRPYLAVLLLLALPGARRLWQGADGAMWSLGVLAEVVFFYFQAERAAPDRRAHRDDGLVRRGGAALRRDRPGLGVAGGAGAGPAAARDHFAAHHCASITAMQRWFGGAAAGARAGAVHEHRLWDRRDLRRAVHVVVLGAAGAGSVYGAAVGLTVLAAGAAVLFWRWERES